MNINLDDLKKTHGENATEIFKKVAHIGGFGDVPNDYVGGLDISGLSDSKQAQIMKVIEMPKDEDTEKNKKAGK